MPIVTRIILLDRAATVVLEAWSKVPMNTEQLGQVAETAERFGLSIDMPHVDEVVACRRCGCTDDCACVDAAGRPCSWVEADLCSRCA